MAAGHKHYWESDSVACYSQFVLAKGRSREALAVWTPLGLVQPTTLPFGQKNSGTDAQGPYRAAAAEMRNGRHGDYVDDWIGWADSEEQLCEDFADFLHRSREEQVVGRRNSPLKQTDSSEADRNSPVRQPKQGRKVRNKIRRKTRNKIQRPKVTMRLSLPKMKKRQKKRKRPEENQAEVRSPLIIVIHEMFVVVARRRKVIDRITGTHPPVNQIW